MRERDAEEHYADFAQWFSEHYWAQRARLGAMHVFWQRTCPARTFGLTHAFGEHDEPGRCVHCGVNPNERDDDLRVTRGEMSAVDIDARMRTLGLARPPEHADDDLVERKAVTGKFPPAVPGSGTVALTEREKTRLWAVRGYFDWCEARDAAR